MGDVWNRKLHTNQEPTNNAMTLGLLGVILIILGEVWSIMLDCSDKSFLQNVSVCGFYVLHVVKTKTVYKNYSYNHTYNFLLNPNARNKPKSDTAVLNL